MSVILGANTPKLRRHTRCRKCGERCHRMNAKIARFSPNQIATMAIKVSMISSLDGRRPPTHAAVELKCHIVREVWFASARLAHLSQYRQQRASSAEQDARQFAPPQPEDLAAFRNRKSAESMGDASPEPPPLPYRETWHIRYETCRSARSASVPASRSASINGNGHAGSILVCTPVTIATALRRRSQPPALALKRTGTNSWLRHRKVRLTSAGTTAK
jgi:hypothetical protein